MGILSGIVNAVTSPMGFVKEAVGLLGNVFGSKEEQNKFETNMLTLVQRRDSEIEETLRQEMAAKERVLVAELNQGDNYTKRARPTVVYAGLGIVFLNHIVLPWIAAFAQIEVPQIEVPPIFWTGWSGIVITWSIGRSAEKMGSKKSVVAAITGNQDLQKRLDELRKAA